MAETSVQYADFLAQKAIVDPPTGLSDVPTLSPALFPFQSDIVRWALRRGRAAIFADCGLGKTLMQLEWAKHIQQHTKGRVLILAPLAVSEQTIREGAKFGITVTHGRTGNERGDLVITNYERIAHFDPSDYAGIVLDESSILKSFTGATSSALIEAFSRTPFRLACTATPAPNDFVELGTHAEFLGAMTRPEMLATFFVHDGGETQTWRLRQHGARDFWTWLASWAVVIRKPSDLGYSDDGFTLPPIHVEQHTVTSEATEGSLFAVEARTLQERLAARRSSVTERATECAAIVNAAPDAWVIWCNLNAEADAIRRLIPDAVEVRGSDSVESKERLLLDFAAGKIRVLVTKPSIAGFGLNWQHCHQMAFVGLSDSWEQYYQATRRCWRFGQLNPVRVAIITAETEGSVVANIKRKETDAEQMAGQMLTHTRALNAAHVYGGGMERERADYTREIKEGDGWTLHLGDCVDVLREMKTASIDFSVFSPPFASLYTYSNSDRDMGNCADADAFEEHFGYAVAEMARIIKPGRLVSFHCMNLPTSKVRDGVIGLRDFRGDLIRLFQSHGFIYHSEVVIWKDPVTAMQRTKALGLLHKTIRNDSSMSRQGIPDYLVTMRAPGANQEPISHTADQFPVSLWQRYASPIWMDIDPQDTLEYRSVRESADERHICPLQLQVIQRALALWSNPGDVVLSPFAGIGSEGVVALENGRRYVGIELKRTYWDRAAKHLAEAHERHTMDLFADSAEATTA